MTFKPLKNHLILILAFTVNFIQAQPITDYWEDGTIKTKGQLLDGERHGFWQKWHSNGSIEYEGSYKQGKSVGIWKYYCKHGFTEKITKWKEGKCYEIVDYFLSGTPNVYLHFEKGLSVQEYIEYHRIEEWCKGNQYRITNMRIDNIEEDSLIHYAFSPIFFYPNNRLLQMQLREEYLYHKDSIVIIEILKNNYLIQFCKSLGQKFEYIEYFYEGAGDTLNMTRTVKLFDDSVLMDLKIEYYEIEPFSPYEELLYLNEKLLSKVSYDINDPEDQICNQYYTNGQIESIVSYKDGQSHGKIKCFSNAGKLMFKGKYKNGELIKSKKY